MAVTGTYNIEIETPMGTLPGKLALKSDGGSLNGTFSAAMGEQSLRDGTVTGEDFTFSVTMDTPMGAMKLDIKGTVSGDNVSGQVQAGSFGSSPFKGTRA